MFDNEIHNFIYILYSFIFCYTAYKYRIRVCFVLFKITNTGTTKVGAETESVWSGIELLKARTSSEEARIKLTNMQTELTEAMREESWSNWEKAKAGVAEISRIMEKLDKEIEGMGFDNEIKNKSKDAIIGNYFADLKVKGQ